MQLTFSPTVAKALGINIEPKEGESDEDVVIASSGLDLRRKMRKAKRMMLASQRRANRAHFRKWKVTQQQEQTILAQAMVLAGEIGTDAQRALLLPGWQKTAAEAGLTLQEGIEAALEAYGHHREHPDIPITMRREPKGRTRFGFRADRRAYEQDSFAGAEFGLRPEDVHRMVSST